MTYDSDCRLIGIVNGDNVGFGFENTTYDLDGNIAVVETSMNHGGGTWKHTFQRYLWGEP